MSYCYYYFMFSFRRIGPSTSPIHLSLSLDRLVHDWNPRSCFSHSIVLLQVSFGLWAASLSYTIWCPWNGYYPYKWCYPVLGCYICPSHWHLLRLMILLIFSISVLRIPHLLTAVANIRGVIKKFVDCLYKVKIPYGTSMKCWKFLKHHILRLYKKHRIYTYHF